MIYFETIPVNNVSNYLNQRDSVLVDLRTEEKYSEGHIPGAINIPYNSFEQNYRQLCKYKCVIVYCERGNMSLNIARKYSSNSLYFINLYGGLNYYRGQLVR